MRCRGVRVRYAMSIDVGEFYRVRESWHRKREGAGCVLDIDVEVPPCRSGGASHDPLTPSRAGQEKVRRGRAGGESERVRAESEAGERKGRERSRGDGGQTG